MFNGLKKIFAKEKVSETITMDYERLKHYFYENIQSKERADIVEARLARDDIMTVIKDLIVVMDSLGKKEIPEKRAKSSELVKNKFVEKSISLFNRMQEIEKINISGYANIEELAETAKKYANKIDLSPKEVMHIKFFFSEEFSEIAKLMSIIYKKIEKLEQIVVGDFAKQKKRIEKCISSIESYENGIREGEGQIKELTNDLNSLEKKRKDVSFTDLDEYGDVRTNIKNIDTRLSYLRQQISSVFGAVTRILKRAYHNKEDELISEYINSPYDAYMVDRDNKIRNLLIKTLIMTKDNELDIDKKSLSKIEEVLEKLDELNQYRKEIDGLNEKMDKLRKNETVLSEKEGINREAEKEMKNVEKRVDQARNDEQNIIKNIENAKLEIIDNKKKKAELVSSMFGKEIELRG
ncbi:MAG: hypothetical protein V1870_05455 [Candidatus Aenigmatarchaeota archaeon]